MPSQADALTPVMELALGHHDDVLLDEFFSDIAEDGAFDDPRLRLELTVASGADPLGGAIAMIPLPFAGRPTQGPTLSTLTVYEPGSIRLQESA